MSNGFNLNTFVPPTILAAPPPSEAPGSGGFGGIFSALSQGLTGGLAPAGGQAPGGFAGLLQTGFGIFQAKKSTDQARKDEKTLAEREFQLELARIHSSQMPPPAIEPSSPVAPAGPSFVAGTGSPVVPAFLSPMLLIGGLGLLAVAALMRR